MLLIADSGSTKTDWALLPDDTTNARTFSTSGINPYYLSGDEIVLLLHQEVSFCETPIDKIFFYGAGCTEVKKKEVSEALRRFFNAGNIEVESDLCGAARSLGQKEECIVSILGTGSNSCYYNGEEIIKNVSPLGYILGDEGSGASLGKKLVADILKNQLNKDIIDDFYASFDLNRDQIIENVYRKPFPNRFLAQFTPFISKQIVHPEIKMLVESCFDEFFVRNIFQYEKYAEHPLRFTGSIAYYFRDNLENVARRHHLTIDKVEKNPLSGLLEYHKKQNHE